MFYFLFFCIPICIGVIGILLLIKELTGILKISSPPRAHENISTDNTPHSTEMRIDVTPVVNNVKKEDDTLLPILSINDDYVSVASQSDSNIEKILKTNKIEKVIFQRLFVDDKGNTYDITEIISRIKRQKTHYDTLRDSSMKYEYHKYSSDNEVITNGTESAN